MANFSETRIQSMITELRDEFGPDIATRELAILELEDMERKGCTHESANTFDQCRDCPKSEKCPVLDWQKRHPEYANDELATKIRILEAGGKEAYEARLKQIEEANKQAKAKLKRLEKQTEAKKLAVKAAKDKLYANLLLKEFAQTKSEVDKWIDEFEADLEAYVQARIQSKQKNS